MCIYEEDVVYSQFKLGTQMNLASEDHLYFETCMSLKVSKSYIQIYIYIKLTLL